ncbi:hypothetical protein UFOVP536_67 [uncultured Caudovirales phage]|uniref:Uncharacterized protein n=1 Tax=uncultured Caudovirales phage TaxID=2100421 RepID=A0A6J5MS25_9CAUD|nr:hypothetical protein UFOVP536_67 [uncultured Caudovirales phage]
MSDYVRAEDVAYVSSTGEYNSKTEIIIFEGNELTKEQWAIVAELPDSEKVIYVQLVLDGEDTEEYEAEFNG